MYRFEKFRVYHSAISLVEEIYKLTKKFPSEEKFALIDQLKRSSTSIVLNIAEGSGSSGDKEFCRFLRIALKSLYETVASLKIAEKLFSLDVNIPVQKCDITGSELNALIKILNVSKS